MTRFYLSLGAAAVYALILSADFRENWLRRATAPGDHKTRTTSAASKCIKLDIAGGPKAFSIIAKKGLSGPSRQPAKVQSWIND